MATDISNLKSNEKKNFPALLKDQVAEISRALPAHLSADRMARIALTAFRRTPKLAQCDPRSVLAAVIQSAQLGLEPDTLGRAYLIPYGNECSFIPGWKGLVDLMNRSGQGSVWTGAVFAGDEFDYQQGDSPYVKHKPHGEADPKMLTHVYAVGRIKGADWPVIEVWTAARVTKHRDRYNKVGKRHYSYENWEMYARKVVLLQVLKYLPCSAELVTAMALNDAGEVGKQGLTVNDAIDGTWVPVEDNKGSDNASDPRRDEQQGDSGGHARPAAGADGRHRPADDAGNGDGPAENVGGPEEGEPASGNPQGSLESTPPATSMATVIASLKACKTVEALDDAASSIDHKSFTAIETKAISAAYLERKAAIEDGPKGKGGRGGME